MAPPKIIITNNDDAWLVYFPRPFIANVKIQGHMTEQNKPPLKKQNSATVPEVNKPRVIINTAQSARTVSVLAG